MRIPLSWLREFVDIDLDPERIAEILTMGAVEVEGVEEVGPEFRGVVVAEVVRVWPHPNASRLSLCEVRIPDRVLQVVCGAPNLREGTKVAFALPGADLAGMRIEARRIRGELSEGMICSEAELRISEDASGIMILEPDAPLGADLGEYLGLKDYILELSPTPNRGDCLSVLGIARELSALTGVPLRLPDIRLKEEEVGAEEFIKVEILAPDHCPRYTARYLWDVKVGPSPFWMRLRLMRSGMRPINNVVDITNYVMLELGQPLHAFDYDRLRERKIVVRLAEDGERFVTLDGKERVLDRQTLMICDAEGPVAIGGVMGGLDSEIEEGTQRVLLESAFFAPSSIRRTSRFLKLETEASHRFSRGVDPELAPYASARAADLMVRYAQGKLAKGIVDVYPNPWRPPKVYVDIGWIRDFLGVDLTEEEAKDYLGRLNMKVEVLSEGRWEVTPPSYRFDIQREVDIAEEVGRLKGYGEIPEKLPRLLPLSREVERSDLERKLKEMMVGYGFYEVLTYSFISPRSMEVLGIGEGLRLLNPLSEEGSVMRTSLLPGLLEVARFNSNRGIKDLRIFELRKVYLPQDGELPREEKRLAALAAGNFWPRWWREKGRAVDFYVMKGCVEGILREFGIADVEFVTPRDISFLHPGQGALLRLKDKEMGFLGRLAPQVEEAFELQGVYVLELNVEELLQRAEKRKVYRPLPRFPGIYRDIALLVDEDMAAEEVMKLVLGCKPPFLERVEFLDCYSGPPLPQGKKNLALRLYFRAEDRTLTDEEANEGQKRVIEALKGAGLQLR